MRGVHGGFMAAIELDEEIKNKLTKTFKVSKEDIDMMIDFFGETLKPEIKYRYLSHIVSTIEDLINKHEKTRIISDIDKIKENINEQKNILKNSEGITKNKQNGLFTITLIPIKKSKKNAGIRFINGNKNALIYYNYALTEKEKRLLIAHELGHIVEHFIFKKNGSEGMASLFAYIAMLDKNKFYREECKDFIFRSDVEIFNELSKILACS